MHRIVPSVVFALSLIAPGVASAAPVSAATASPTTYTITPLTSPTGYAFSSAHGLNNSGSVAGLLTSSAGGRQAARWTGTSWQQLGDGEASDVNTSGVSVGYLNVNQSPHATMWQPNGARRDLGALTTGGWSQGVAINDLGVVVGNASQSNGTRAFIWQSSTGMKALSTLGTGNTYAYAINERSEVAGTASGKAVRWNAQRQIQDLGAGANSVAYGINTQGTIVGATSDQGFVWENGRLTKLGSSAGVFNATAQAINDNNEIVGGAIMADADGMPLFHAVAWHNGTMVDLNTRISSTSGWELNTATGINAQGQIVGNGTYKGQTRAFLLTPKP
jgi:probable HAF family extracellular repeat protein